MPEYGKPEYWDQRYGANSSNFDWYMSYQGLKEHLEPYLKSDCRILMVGCGNSRLSEGLYEAGYKSIVNIDISSVCIEQMKERYSQSHPDMDFITMDATKLDLPSESFDVVIDKGTLDAILCGTDSYENAAAMLKEISRVLKPAGSLLVITYGQPDTRMEHFEKRELSWSTSHTLISASGEDQEPGSTYHMYAMTKGGSGSSSSAGAVGASVSAEEDDEQFYKAMEERIRSSAAVAGN